MTQEQKELLHRDLSARLPYKVKCYNSKYRQDLAEEIICITINNNYNCVQLGTYLYKLEDVKPYLFPLSSMTEEQKKEYDKIIYRSIELHHREYSDIVEIDLFDDLQDFYHKNHLDYRGLIPMGLAIDATGLNIY